MSNKKSFIMGIVIGMIFSLIIVVGGRQFVPETRELDTQDRTLKKLNTIYSTIKNNYVDELTPEQMTKMEEGIYKGFLNGVQDPYTVYFSPKEFQDFMVETKGEYAGIGVVVSKDEKDNLITVVSPFEGSPGAEAGILPKDKILRVDGKDVVNMNLEEAVTLIKGKKGTKVKLDIIRANEEKILEIEVTRDIIKIETVRSEILENNIGYIRISQFEEKTAEDFLKQYEDLRKKQIKGLIIDLRNNPGGLLNVVTEITEVLVPKGTIVYTIDRKGTKEEYKSNTPQIDIPLVVLVNDNSASASEILSGAVKDYKSGTLIGTKTYGKGVVQSILPLADGSAVKVTTSRYYTPKGISIQGIGIEPDIVVELPPELENLMEVPREKDTQLKKAIEALK